MPTTARKPRTCPDCGHRQYHHLNIVATCAVRCDRCKDDQLHVPLLHVQREQRIAATLARRGTPEWRAGGAHLVAERAQAEGDRAHRRAEAAMQGRLQAERDASEVTISGTTEHQVATRADGTLPSAPAGPGRRYVLNIWTAATGWARHIFATEALRADYAGHGATPDADVHWSDR